MIDTLKVVREIYALWNNPADTRLVPGDVMDALNRRYKQRLIELGLSGGNYLGKFSAPFYFQNGQSRKVNVSDVNTIIRLEMRGCNSCCETDWQEVVEGNYSDWGSYQNNNKPYFALIGSGQSAQIILNFEPSSNVFRLFYENSGSFSVDGQMVEIPDLFAPLMVYDTALEAGVLIDDQSEDFERIYNRKMKAFVVRQDEALTLFQRWLSERKSQSAQTRESFSSRRQQLYGFPRDIRLKIP